MRIWGQLGVSHAIAAQCAIAILGAAVPTTFVVSDQMGQVQRARAKAEGFELGNGTAALVRLTSRERRASPGTPR